MSKKLIEDLEKAARNKAVENFLIALPMLLQEAASEIKSLNNTIASCVEEKYTAYGDDVGFLAYDVDGRNPIWVNSVCIRIEKLEQELSEVIKEKGGKQ